MFFILSKLLYFLLYPLTWVAILFFLKWKTNNPVVKKRLFIAIILLVLLFGNEVLQNKIETAWQINNSQLQPNKQYGAAIILGGLSGFDTKGKGYFLGSADRFIQVVQLYHTQKIKSIIVSGGSGKLLSKEPAEADFIVQQLQNSGVPDSCIIRENTSRNTFENAQHCKKIADSLQLPTPFVLVSSANHLPRAKMVFEKAGMPVVLHPADFHSFPKKFNWYNYFLPDIMTIDRWRFLLKEFIGVVVYKLTGKA
jgi:uncharacterized SAM-binding protein YcdF (DUF218 family)